MQTHNHARQLARVLKRLPAAPSHTARPDPADPIAVLVHSFLLWEAPADKARSALERLSAHVVDFNELRVNLPHETAVMLGQRYPRVEERCARLRASLNDIYRREHAVTLERLRTQGKRDVKRYLDTLEGIVPFVAARVGLLCFDVHGIPADERLRAQLARREAADPEADLGDLGAWLARHVKSDAGAVIHHRLQAWADAHEDRGDPRPPRAAAPAAKSSVKRAVARGKPASRPRARKPAARR